MNRRLSRIATCITALALLLTLSACNHSSFRPPGREGPPGLVKHGDEAHLWLMTKQEEQRQRHIGGSRSVGKWVSETWYHFSLEAHDPATAARVWKKELLKVKDDEGGHSSQSRIVGQDGEIVWLFLHDQPVAVSSTDGSLLVDAEGLEAKNPELRDLIPKDLDFYAYDDGLIITAADARLWRIRGPEFKAEPYVAPNDDYFRNVQFMATRWNGGFSTKDFLARHANVDGKWLGLYSVKEAIDAGNDEWGDHYKKPDIVWDEGSQARRTFWTARIGRTREFSEGSHDRLFDVTRVPGAPEFLQSGWLVKQGTRQPLRLSDPGGFLVVHRTRLDEEGRLAITRLDDALKPQWTATLPYHELRNRFENANYLLMYGLVQETVKGVTGTSEHIVSLDLRDGKVHAWNVTLERQDAAVN